MNIIKKDVSKNVMSFTFPEFEHWEYFQRKNEKQFYNITGKYLFFSENRDTLVSIAINEIENFGFHHAKIVLPNKKVGKDFVCCLYYKDDSRKFELNHRHSGNKNIRFRFWKSDTDTIAGKYSEQHKKDIREA